MVKLIISVILVFAFIGDSNAGPIPGDYGSLLIAVNEKENTISGYYEEYSGWDASTRTPRFSCIFYLKGSISSGTQYKIKTWFPADRDSKMIIPGLLILSENSKTLSIKLNKEHGGCWNVEPFAGEKAPHFNLVKQANWLDIRIVASEKAYFYKKPDDKYRRKAYLIKGDVLKVLEKKVGWLFAEYENDAGKITKGWIKENDLLPNKPPS